MTLMPQILSGVFGIVGLVIGWLLQSGQRRKEQQRFERQMALQTKPEPDLKVDCILHTSLH